MRRLGLVVLAAGIALALAGCLGPPRVTRTIEQAINGFARGVNEGDLTLLSAVYAPTFKRLLNDDVCCDDQGNRYDDYLTKAGVLDRWKSLFDNVDTRGCWTYAFSNFRHALSSGGKTSLTTATVRVTTYSFVQGVENKASEGDTRFLMKLIGNKWYIEDHEILLGSVHFETQSTEPLANRCEDHVPDWN